MKRWTMYVMACALMLIGQQAMAQFNAFIAYSTPDPALTTVCGGNTAIPDGRLIKIFQDVDADGPDFDDPQPTVCSNPPDCNEPFDAVNFNQLPMNGLAMTIGEGYFLTEPAFTCNSTIPGNGRFYVRVYEPDNTTILWTSRVFTVVNGLQDVIFVQADWTCGSVGPQCTVIDESE